MNRIGFTMSKLWVVVNSQQDSITNATGRLVL